MNKKAASEISITKSVDIEEYKRNFILVPVFKKTFGDIKFAIYSLWTKVWTVLDESNPLFFIQRNVSLFFFHE